ncbi:MAG: ComEA family DNA-binding protein [Lachnospiraceae bacterium]|nr:ComEA family DNA-binding protein [Lachnospiraceae bacterium]
MKQKIIKMISLMLFAVGFFAACREEVLIQDIGGTGTGSDEMVSEDVGDGGMVLLADSAKESNENMLLVHVCGAVSVPGVYELPVGSRINHAVEAAGGFDMQADKEGVNLVEEISDGEQIRIPFIGEETYTEDEGLININQADVDMLCEIPGIGESRAMAIVEYREEHGGFTTMEELMQVPGIKEGIYARISSYIECR